MSGRYVMHRGVHVPACISIDDHIEAAVRESSGHSIADSGDAAVIAFWRQAEADHQARFLA